MPRLTRDKWIRHGLATLSGGGVQAVRVLPMTKALRVSRGSFYWHFESLETFLEALLERWAETTSEVVADLADLTTPEAQLRALIGAALQHDLELERQVRAWASVDARAEAVVRVVDEQRLAVLVDTMRAAGLEPDDAAARAKVLYAASLGQLVASPGLVHLDPVDVAKVAALLVQVTSD
ncbi:MAG: TetR/AcrR family transcriptional regulator [Myxococcota bacterium]